MIMQETGHKSMDTGSSWILGSGADAPINQFLPPINQKHSGSRITTILFIKPINYQYPNSMSIQWVNYSIKFGDREWYGDGWAKGVGVDTRNASRIIILDKTV